jgi:hypothetical protein
MEMERNIDTFENEYKGKEMAYLEGEQNNEIYVEVDLEEEIICALRKINKLKKENLKQKKQMKKYEEEDHDEK